MEISQKEPRVLLMGLRRSFINFQVWDFPGQIDFFDPTFDAELIFGEDDYSESLTKLYETIIRAYRVNANIIFEVFIHKVDGLSEDLKFETQRDIQQRILDELSDNGLENQVLINFYLTSIYDHSIYESFSKVIQKLIKQLPTLENLINVLCSNSGIEKAYLFDITSKIYIATDSSPVDLMSYEICCDLIDVVVDMTIIYQTNYTNKIEDNYSIIKLDNDLILYYREINKYLGMVCLIKSEYWDKHTIIDFNFDCFKAAIIKVLDVRNLYLEEDYKPDGLGIS